MSRKVCALSMIVALLVSGCAQPQTPAAPTSKPAAPAATGAPAAQPAAATAPPKPAAEATKPAAQPAATAAPAAKPAPTGGTLRVAIPSNPTGYIITQSAGLPDAILGKMMGSGLVRYDAKTLEPVPDLATSWEASPDAKTWTFKLRQGVTWHDGKPFTADDVKFTFDTMLNKDVNARMRGNIAGLEKVEIVDSQTVRFVFGQSFAPLPIMLGYNMAIVPKHALEGKDLNNPADFIRSPLGTGPFKFKEAVSGSHYTVEAYDKYWDGKPQLEQIVFKVVPDVNAQVAQLKAGELDVALIQPKNIDALKDAPNVAISKAEQVNYFYISLNNKRPMFQDVRVRKALMLGLDRQAIVETILQGEGKVADAPIAPAITWAYADSVTKYPFDVARAKAMLAEAGWTPGPDGIVQKDGEKMSFTMITARGVLDGEQLATVAQQYYKQIGVDAKVQLVEFADLWTSVLKGDFDASVEYLVTAPDPDSLNSLGCNGGTNRFGYCNPQVDQLLMEARATPDQKKRAELYARFQQMMADEPAGVYLYYPLEVRAIAKRVQGFPEINLRDAFFWAHKMSVAQ